MTGIFSSRMYSIFIYEPYGEAVSQLKKVVTNGTSAPMRVVHLVAGGLLLVPVVNVVILVAVRFFSQASQNFSSQNIQDRKIAQFKGQENEKRDIQVLTDAKIFDGAWRVYRGIYNKHPDFQPPEELITAIVDQASGTDTLLARVPIECVRDCALIYPQFYKKCLQEEKLWNAFNAYPEYLADIAKRNDAFAFELITSKRGTNFSNDTYRFEIFYSAYPQFIERIESGKITDDEMKYLVAFLLRYRLVVTQDDFSRVNKIRQSLEGRLGENQQQIKYVDLVLGKFSLQGICREGENLLLSFEDEGLVDVLALSRFEVNELEVAQRIAALERKDIQKGVSYLESIQKTAVNYIQARMTLGNIWMDQGEMKIAGQYFLEAAQIQEGEARKDALKLAATCLLVKSEDGHYQARKKQEAAQDTLTINDTQGIVTDETAFFALLRSTGCMAT